MKVSDIATFISKQPKAAKAQKPFDILRRAISDSGESDTVTLDFQDIAALYAHFMPKTAKAKVGVFDFAWVAKAMAKKDAHHFLNYVYSDGLRLMATDGHRLHILNGQSLPQGYYTAAGDKVDETATYVPVDRVIPNYSDCQTWTLTAEELAACVVDTGDQKDLAFAYKLPSGHLVQQKYLDDAMNGADVITYHSLPFTPKSADALSPNSILIRNGNVQVVIMPRNR